MIDYKAVVESLITRAKKNYIPVELVVEDTTAMIKFSNKNLVFSETNKQGLNNESYRFLLEQLIIHIGTPEFNPNLNV